MKPMPNLPDLKVKRKHPGARREGPVRFWNAPFPSEPDAGVRWASVNSRVDSRISCE